MQKNNTKTTTNTMQRKKTIKQDILHAWASEVVRVLQQDDMMAMLLVIPMWVLMMVRILLMMLMILLARSCCCGKLVAAPWVARYSNTSPHYTILTRPTCLRRDHVWLLAISDTPITLATNMYITDTISAHHLDAKFQRCLTQHGTISLQQDDNF